MRLEEEDIRFLVRPRKVMASQNFRRILTFTILLSALPGAEKSP